MSRLPQLALVATLAASVASWWLQANVEQRFRSNLWGLVFPALAFAGLGAVRIFSARHRDTQAFLASCLYLAGMLATAAFGQFPNLLPSNDALQPSLTIYNAAAASYGLTVGLFWFIPGLCLALLYSFFVYKQFSGKVA